MIRKTITKQDLEVINIADMKAMWDCGFKDNRIATLSMTHISHTETHHGPMQKRNIVVFSYFNLKYRSFLAVLRYPIKPNI